MLGEADYHHDPGTVNYYIRIGGDPESAHCCSQLCSEAQADAFVAGGCAWPAMNGDQFWMTRLTNNTGHRAQTCPIAPWLHRFQED
jgi:hypothetical protein